MCLLQTKTMDEPQSLPRVKSKSAACKSNYPELYKKSIHNLRRAIKGVKGELQTKQESSVIDTDTHRLWQSLHAIMGYKVKAGSIGGNNGPLPDKLNAIYARFEQKFGGGTSFTPPVFGTPIPTVTITNISSAFLEVHCRKQLVLMDSRPCPQDLHGPADRGIHKLYSLTICSKKSTIVPVPKNR